MFETMKPMDEKPAPCECPAGENNGREKYREPQIFPIGTAVELLQRDGTGHLRDGTGGWWVWGS